MLKFRQKWDYKLKNKFESFQSPKVKKKSKNWDISTFSFQFVAEKYRWLIKDSYFIFGL
jgi:hypothetical protein